MIRQLTLEDAKDFSNLILDMYSNLDNLEWFSPMPFDLENVKGMISHPRFYIIGYFENDILCGVGSLDYKCGKLLGKIDLPMGHNSENIVELGFHMVSSKHRGHGIMKKLVNHLLNKLNSDGYKFAFAKVHCDNFASSTSLIRNGFNIYSKYNKPVKKEDFIFLSSQEFFSKKGKENARITLEKNKDNEDIIVDYNILVKELI